MSEELPEEESFISHLVELRARLLRAIAAIGVIFLALLPWATDIYDFLAGPLTAALPPGARMIAVGVVTPIIGPIKVTMAAAFVLALPMTLYQAWAFVAPGLYAHERRVALPLALGSTLLFLAGMAFCYFFVFGMVFRFIAQFAPESVVPAPDIEQYLSFVTTMFIAFGATFEVPVAVILLVRAGVVSVAKLREIRPYVLVGALVVGAILTPPDVISQIMLAAPICLLYEAGILIAAILARPMTPPRAYDTDGTPALPPSGEQGKK
ncbi:MAG: twin-arginine translocase subunit TatC [Azoarcus sp.]|jgi:sec-independent protein translocase protein TatC|nr:twin-arginine translocase subunit TatC [Azoarcus sp.]